LLVPASMKTPRLGVGRDPETGVNVGLGLGYAF